MPDLVVTVPKWFWPEWISEGDAAGEPYTGETWGFFMGGIKPDIGPGDRLYIVAHNRVRGYAPVIKLATPAETNANGQGYRWGILRQGDGVAITIPGEVKGFQGWRRRWWDRSIEIEFADWKTAGVQMNKPKKEKQNESRIISRNVDSQSERPLCFFDIESTGTDISKDRIVTMSGLKIVPPDLLNTGLRTFTLNVLANPGFDMTPEVMAIHGITNELARTYPPFSESADEVLAFFTGCDLGGYNCMNFDIPLLWEELDRAGKDWKLEGVNTVDAGNIFKIKETRTLAAAMKFFCDKELQNAHNSQADNEATLEVFLGQRRRYQDVGAMGLEAVAQFCKMDDRVDLAGHVIKDKDGDYAYGLKSKRGVKVTDDPGFARWMLSKDFSNNTKKWLDKILREIYGQ